MTFAIIFLLVFVALGIFAFYLSRTIEHGEARFDANGRLISDREPQSSEPARPARRIEQTETTGNDT